MDARDFITKDFGWKLLSLALALAIWLTVSAVSRQGTTTTTTTAPGVSTTVRIFSRMPITPVSGDADVREYKFDPDNVTVSVSGPNSIIANLSEKEIRATVDLTGFSSKSEPRRRVDVSTPPGVTFVSANPSQVSVLSPLRIDQ
jgi:YbbR domain-containing protein